ncbi:MAG: hypothetical protein ACFFAU_10005 [Candidatus Hodarchaeota archaeon]
MTIIQGLSQDWSSYIPGLIKWFQIMFVDGVIPLILVLFLWIIWGLIIHIVEDGF